MPRTRERGAIVAPAADVSVRSLETLRATFERYLQEYGELPILIRQNCLLFPDSKKSRVGWIHQFKEWDAVLQRQSHIRQNIIREICYLLPDTEDYDLRRQSKLDEMASGTLPRSYREPFLRSYHADYYGAAADWWQFIAEIGLRRLPDCAFKLNRSSTWGHPGYHGVVVGSFDDESELLVKPFKDDEFGISGMLCCDVSSGWYAWHHDCYTASMQVLDWLIELAENGELQPAPDAVEPRIDCEGMPTLSEQLLHICQLMDAGVPPIKESHNALNYSIEVSQQSPGKVSADSVHITGQPSDIKKLSTAAVEISKRLPKLARLGKKTTPDQMEVVAKQFRKLVELWANVNSPSKTSGKPDQKRKGGSGLDDDILTKLVSFLSMHHNYATKELGEDGLPLLNLKQATVQQMAEAAGCSTGSIQDYYLPELFKKNNVRQKPAGEHYRQCCKSTAALLVRLKSWNRELPIDFEQVSPELFNKVVRKKSTGIATVGKSAFRHSGQKPE